MPRECWIKSFNMKPLNVNLDLSTPQVMAILNVTPDSFYGKSRSFTEQEIVERTQEIITEGASIIDVGGYSSRPGAEDITADEEWGRVERAIRVIRTISTDVTLSLDTFRAEVAERAIKEFGALIINDISAGEIDSKMIEIVAKYNVPYIAMHMRGTPQTMQQHCDYQFIVDDVSAYLTERCNMLKLSGVNNIIVDPGFGFAKNVEQNFELLNGLNNICNLGYPVLSGISRKSMIYKTLDITANEALAGTIALNWESLRAGASILRVHDVREAVETVKLYNALMGAKSSAKE